MIQARSLNLPVVHRPSHNALNTTSFSNRTSRKAMVKGWVRAEAQRLRKLLCIGIDGPLGKFGPSKVVLYKDCTDDYTQMRPFREAGLFLDVGASAAGVGVVARV